MRILVRNKKWETTFKNITIICKVYPNNGAYNIDFKYRGKNISINTYNLDLTFKYLEKCFNWIDGDQNFYENKIA